jgi:Uma2 family endonuclease
MAVAERELTLPVEEFVPDIWRFTREQFHWMGENRLFEGQRVILIEGEIRVMPPIGDLHRGTVTLAADVFREVFGIGFFVSEEKPFDIGEATDPQPDIAVIAGVKRDFLYCGLTEAALIVEVSDSTLRYDRRQKASLYAKAGIEDYWIINIDHEPPQVEVHRHPRRDKEQTHGSGYGEHTIYLAGELIQPLNAPKPVAVADLLP